MRGFSLVAASGGHSSSRCTGLSLSRPLLLWSTGSRRAGSAIVAHGPSHSAACGIFPDQGSNPCPLHWQADSQSLHYQGSPINYFWKQFVIWFSKEYSKVEIQLLLPNNCIWETEIKRALRTSKTCLANYPSQQKSRNIWNPEFRVMYWLTLKSQNFWFCLSLHPSLI